MHAFIKKRSTVVTARLSMPESVALSSIRASMVYGGDGTDDTLETHLGQ